MISSGYIANLGMDFGPRAVETVVAQAWIQATIGHTEILALHAYLCSASECRSNPSNLFAGWRLS